MLMERKARQGRKIPEVLTEEEQRRLLEQPNRRYPTGQRNFTMMKVMLDTGLRLSEAINLRWKDIDLTSGKVMVRQGKGAKDRTLWIGEGDLGLLQGWKERQAQDVKGKTGHVFTTLQGRKLNPAYIRAMVYRYTAKAGIDKQVSPHTLRHSFATDLYRDTSKIRLVQKALGHANLATTQIYTHIVDEELEEALKSFRRPAFAT
jgi:integrase/recombinase XerD